MQPSLIMYDDSKGAFWAAGVRSKGVSEAIVKYVKGILDQSGYECETLTFKTHQELSIVALKSGRSCSDRRDSADRVSGTGVSDQWHDGIGHGDLTGATTDDQALHRGEVKEEY